MTNYILNTILTRNYLVLAAEGSAIYVNRISLIIKLLSILS